MQHYERMKLKKLIQSVAYLLSLNKKKMNYTKLLKLLYIADKQALKTWDKTITGDAYVSMENGPVLSRTYDLVMDRGPEYDQLQWNINFYTLDYCLYLKDYVPDDELSEGEEKILKSIFKKYEKWDWKKIVNYIHKHPKEFPEYKNPGKKTSSPIKLKTILKGLGRTEPEINEILNKQDAYEKEHSFFINNFA